MTLLVAITHQVYVFSVELVGL